MEPKRLYRSRENRVLCGVCGGIAGIFQRGSGFDPAWNGFVYLLPVLEPVFWHILIAVSDHAGSEIGE